jgi:hypothetical protein
MLRSLIAVLVAHWLTIRVVTTFVALIALFFTLMTYNPIVKRIDIASVLAQLSAWLSWRRAASWSTSARPVPARSRA